jgi:hypothetical protein
MPLVSLAAGACGGEGHVRVRLEEPSPGLSPFEDELAEVTLTIESDDGASQVFQATWGADVEVALQDIHVADEAWFTIEGHRENRRMVGFGRADAPVRITAEDDVEVVLPFRRPYAYFATDARVKAFHTGADVTSRMEDMLRFEPNGFLDGAATALTAVPGGRWVAVAGGGQLTLVDTATHEAVPLARVDLGATSDLAATPSGRFVVALLEDGSGIVIVDLAEMLADAGAGAARSVPVTQAGVVTVTSSTAFVVTNAGECTGGSSLVAVPIDPPGDPGTPVALGACVNDAKVEAAGNRIALAQRPGSLVVRGVVDDATPAVTLPVMSPTTVTIAGGRAVAFGHELRGDGDHLVLASMALDGGDQRLVLLPSPEVGQYVQIDDGERGDRLVAADVVQGVDVSAVPDGSLVAVIAESTHQAPELDLFFFSFPPVNAVVSEYFLLDVLNGTVVQFARTHVQDEFNDYPITTREEFMPRRISILNGDR